MGGRKEKEKRKKEKGKRISPGVSMQDICACWEPQTFRLGVTCMRDVEGTRETRLLQACVFCVDFLKSTEGFRARKMGRTYASVRASSDDVF